MNKTQFIQLLEQEGYPQSIEVKQQPNGSLGNHAHPFAVMALVIEGSIDLTIQEKTKTYEPGDVFQLEFEELHAESYGPDGVTYLASRKQFK
jgi:quercetin dioxygenase-like cupin family protein